MHQEAGDTGFYKSILLKIRPNQNAAAARGASDHVLSCPAGETSLVCRNQTGL